MSGSDSAGSGTVLAGNNPGSTLDLNVNSAFANLSVSEILLEATHDITLANGTFWNLSGTIGANSGGVTSGQLTLEAGNDIVFQDGSAIVDANNWSVTLKAGVNNFTTGAVQPGVGNIYLNGGDGLLNGGSIQTAGGDINLTAGQDIETGGGSLQDAQLQQFCPRLGFRCHQLDGGTEHSILFATRPGFRRNDRRRQHQFDGGAGH